MHKIKITYLILTFLIVASIVPVFAFTTEQKSAILSNFKKKEEQMIFESDFDLGSLSVKDLFKSNSKVQVYEDIRDKINLEKRNLQSKREEALDEILSLKSSIDNIEKDIVSLLKETQKINVEVVSIKEKIKANENKIVLLNKKVEDSTAVIVDYLVYLYKKGNLVYTDGEMDNLKAIILSSDNLDGILGDIYYKELISIAGKKLIEKHKKYIFSLYVEKKELEESSKRMKDLRRESIIKTKLLSDKKEFKKRMLTISKGKDALYKKYIEGKINIEKEIKIKAFKEKIKFNKVSKELLGNYNCKFVDLSKNTPESRTLSKKCRELNTILALESKLISNKTNAIQNVLEWPVAPVRGISAYFQDDSYKDQFGTDHFGIDIPVNQGTDVLSAADGYVVYVEEPDNADYAYIAIKHADGFVTVYGHISEALVKKYDSVKAGDIIAKSGGEYGTNGAGFLTTGPHLHFEVFKDKEHRDALDFLNISILSFDRLPNKYKIKFYTDYKERTGREYRKKLTGSIFKLDGSSEVERQKSLLEKYARPDFNDWDMWVEESLEWDIDPTFIMCIGLAESSLGNNLKTSYNIGNVGNTDSGGTWELDNPKAGIYWIGKTLNNKYFSDVNSIGLLSGAGRVALGAPKCNSGPNSFCYATDERHWHNNVIKCMTFIKGKYIPDDYDFRLK